MEAELEPPVQDASCPAPDAEPRGGRHDLRTRAGRREEILAQIERHGGFSIFWVAENRLRAAVAQDMQERGEIETDNETHGFPWIGAKIANRKNQNQNQTGGSSRP